MSDSDSDIDDVLYDSDKEEKKFKKIEPKRAFSPNIKRSNSPSSRKKLFSDNYQTKYSSDKIKYYKTLGKYHIDDVDDSSTDFTESSDDFPSPSPIKYRSERDKERERSNKEREKRDKERKDRRR